MIFQKNNLLSPLGDKGRPIILHPEYVSSCHVLPPRNNDNGNIQPPRAGIRFTSRKAKTAIIKQAKQLKVSYIYINEPLTSTNQTLAWAARQLKKKRLITSTWTVDCKVLVRPLGYEARVRRIRGKYHFMECGLKSEDVNPLFINRPSLPKN